MHNFRKLTVWNSAMSLTVELYKITEGFPKPEMYGLTSQMRRAAVSIPSNIAEGSGRTSNKEFIRFLEIAISSSYELETQLILSEQIFNLSTKEIIENLHSLQNRIGGFMRQIKERIDSDN